MTDIMIEVLSDDDENMSRIIRDIVNYEIVLNEHPLHGTIQLDYQCDHYHIKKGNKINIMQNKREGTNPVYLLPAVVKRIDGNLLYFEERPVENLI